MSLKTSQFQNGTKITINDIELDTNKAIIDILEKNKQKWKLEVQKKTPVGNTTPHLKDEITTTILNENGVDKLVIWCGDKSYIAHFVEFGTEKMSPRPFMRPAFEKIQKEFEQEILSIDWNKYIK